MTRETRLTISNLIWPVFVTGGQGNPEAVGSMPGVFRYSLRDIASECQKAWELGIPAVAIFPVIDTSLKTPRGEHSISPKNILFEAIQKIKQACPDLIVIADVALDPYTSHGHDGILTADGKDVDNDSTVHALTELAVAEAKAGADWVAPSDMMDGRVGAIRQALDQAGFTQTSILAYSAKFASAYYGPFRDAVGSKQASGNTYLDKQTYQLQPANIREALMEASLDENEGADILMVKPAGAYLDVISRLREQSTLPLAAYQVSGEYAQIQAAAQLGWLDLEKTRMESLIAIRRAGADMILTYFARQVAPHLPKT